MRTVSSTTTIAAALLLGSAALTSAPALGQPGPAGVQAAQNADELFRTGKAHYKAGKLEQAYEAYRAAWRLKRSYDIGANLANAEMLLKKPRDAAEHLAFCIKSFPPTGSKAQLDQVKAQFEEARREIGAITIRVNVDGAEVLVDGASIGRAPIADEIYLDPGTRTIEAKLSGYADAKQVIQVARGPAQAVTIDLKAAAPPAPPPPVPPVVVVPQEKRPLWPAVVTGVVAAGGLAVGAGLTVAANGKGSEADTLRAAVGSRTACHGAASASVDCRSLDSAVRAKSVLYNAAFGAFLGGGMVALAAGGLGIWAAAPKRDVRVTPAIGVDRAGVVLVGVW